MLLTFSFSYLPTYIVYHSTADFLQMFIPLLISAKCNLYYSRKKQEKLEGKGEVFLTYMQYGPIKNGLTGLI